MDLHNLTSIPHLHAAARRQDYLREADNDRLVTAFRKVRPANAGVRRQLGGALIRAGELVRGPLATTGSSAVSRQPSAVSN